MKEAVLFGCKLLDKQHCFLLSYKHNFLLLLKHIYFSCWREIFRISLQDETYKTSISMERELTLFKFKGHRGGLFCLESGHGETR